MHEVYAFVDNSFLYAQGYKHARSRANIPDNKKPQINYKGLKTFFSSAGQLRRMVLVGSELSGKTIANCQRIGIDALTLPRYPDLKTGKRKEKGVDHKIVWEIAKTIFHNRDSTRNKKIILCSGDKDFMSILGDIHTAGWDFELWLWSNSYSQAFATQVQSFGSLKELDNEWNKFISIVDK